MRVDEHSERSVNRSPWALAMLCVEDWIGSRVDAKDIATEGLRGIEQLLRSISVLRIKLKICRLLSCTIGGRLQFLLVSPYYRHLRMLSGDIKSQELLSRCLRRQVLSRKVMPSSSMQIYKCKHMILWCWKTMF